MGVYYVFREYLIAASVRRLTISCAAYVLVQIESIMHSFNCIHNTLF